jgi:Rrf2 family protein
MAGYQQLAQAEMMMGAAEGMKKGGGAGTGLEGAGIGMGFAMAGQMAGMMGNANAQKAPESREQIMSTLKHGGIVRTTLGAHGGYALAVDPATVSIGRVIRLLDGALAPLPCVSLRFYDRCSCRDEATCSLRDVMLDVRDSMLEILDRETLTDLAARHGRASIDPRGIHGEALAGRRP